MCSHPEQWSSNLAALIENIEKVKVPFFFYWDNFTIGMKDRIIELKNGEIEGVLKTLFEPWLKPLLKLDSPWAF